MASHPYGLVGLVSDPTEEPPGFDLPQKQWSALNRIRTLHARRPSHHLHKCNFKDSPACETVVTQIRLFITLRMSVTYGNLIKDVWQST